MSHSREPWLVQKPHAGKRGFEVADNTGKNQVCQDLTEENARRIAACVNFCIGVSTENLETNNPLLVLLDDFNAAKKQVAALSKPEFKACPVDHEKEWPANCPRCGC